MLNERTKDIDSIIELINRHLNNQNEINTVFLNALLLNTEISNIIIYPIDTMANTQLGWQFTRTDKGKIKWICTQNVGENFRAEIKMKENWIEDQLIPVGISFPYLYAFVDSEATVLASNNNNLINKSINLDLQYIDELLTNNNTDEYGFIKKFSFLGSDIKFKSYITHVEAFNNYLVVFHPRTYVFEYLGRYTAFIMLIVSFLMVLTSYIIIRTNRRLAWAIKDIFATIKNSKYLSINPKSSENDLMQIKRNVESLINQLSIYEKKLEQTVVESQKIEHDLIIAKRLQQSLLPKQNKQITKHEKLFKIGAYSEALYDIGGDLYDYFILDGKHLLFMVGDVSGKGIPAALFMIYTQTLLRSIAKRGMSVGEIVTELNSKLANENTSELFVTLLIGMLDIETGLLEYCNAAHNLPLVIKNDGHINELADTHGIPLGIYANKKYGQSVIQLAQNDQIFIYTDGVIDIKDENGMNYSIDVLRYNLMGSWFNTPDQIVKIIMESVNSFRGNIAPVDDMTILVLQYINKGKIHKE
ncbi:MAG TPA: PP2C family protein-serine/threonine phosphatase [Prolixibacteraceae bacterium]|nr:PP2C family protein-serine/threonine phosphatase [Prolixibacteraceae bacterium]